MHLQLTNYPIVISKPGCVIEKDCSIERSSQFALLKNFTDLAEKQAEQERTTHILHAL